MMLSYGNGVFVAVGKNGKILTSTNITIWTQQTSGTTARLSGVAFGNNTFVAVGDNGTVLRSIDNGLTWNSPWNSPLTTQNLYGVTYANSVKEFIAVGHNGAIYRSINNGLIWTQDNSPVTDVLFSVSHGNNTFVIVGDSGKVLTCP
jgi:photosystem II stability/assembly factor-like uncharacterized protein